MNYAPEIAFIISRRSLKQKSYFYAKLSRKTCRHCVQLQLKNYLFAKQFILSVGLPVFEKTQKQVLTTFYSNYIPH